MNTHICTRKRVERVLGEEGFRPLRQLGQNFLIEPSLASLIVDALQAPAGADVIEIGPGLGALTVFALQKGWRLICLEKDRGFARYLTKTFSEEKNFKLIEVDALDDLQHAEHAHVEFILGNLPYNISTPLIMAWSLWPMPPKEVVLTLQKELVERLMAKPRTKAYGAVTVFVQSLYQIELLRSLPSHVFYPKPKVDSAVVRLTLKKMEWLAGQKEREEFYSFLRRGFQQRRKMLRSVFPVGSTARAEELNLQEWKELYEDVRKRTV